jgi:hypothetical protein
MVCTMHKEMRSTLYSGLTSKPMATILVVWPQNRQLRFSDLAHKITMTVSWLGPQNQVEDGLSVAPQNRREDEDSVGRTLRSSGLLHLEVSQASISQFCLKTGEGAMAGGAHGIVTEVVWM